MAEGPGAPLRRGLRGGAGSAHRRGGRGHPRRAWRAARSSRTRASGDRPRLRASAAWSTCSIPSPGPDPVRRHPARSRLGAWRAMPGSWSPARCAACPALRPLRPRPRLRGLLAARGDDPAAGACLALGIETRGADQRGGRPQPGLRAGRRDAHHRSHQPVRRQPAARARTSTASAPRFPAMTDAYDPELRARGRERRPSEPASRCARGST